MRIGLCQLDICWEDRAASRNRIAGLLDSCKDSNMDWLIFPEFTLSGFTLDTGRATLDAADTAFFAGLARDRGCWLTYGGVDDGKNCLFTLDRTGRLLHRYEKRHLFSFGNEHRSYREGPACGGFALDGWRVSPAVCYDLRFTYLFWACAPSTDLYVVIANWPAARRHHWETLLRARAIENLTYVIGVNRAGASPDTEYAGGSLVIDPTGAVLLDAGARETIGTVELDRALVARTREQYPFLRDRKQ